MKEFVITVLLYTGAFFLLIASVGILRLPDVYMRMSAASKAITLGIACLLAALTLHFEEGSVTTRAVLVVAFFFFTMPVAAHMIGRAAYLRGTPLWEKTVVDELKGHYPSQVGPRLRRPRNGRRS